MTLNTTTPTVVNMIAPLHMVVGPMASGKSTELIRLFDRAVIADQLPVLIRPAQDTRGDGYLLTHKGTKMGGHLVKGPQGFQDACLKPLLDSGKMSPIFVDEVQFFEPWIVDAITKIRPFVLGVTCFGLDLDAKGQTFGSVPELLCRATTVTKLTAVCLGSGCCADATRTHRVTPWLSNDIVAPGGLTDYAPLCEDCYATANPEDL